MATTAEVITRNASIEPYYSHGLRKRYHLDAFKLPVFENAQVYADIEYRADNAKYHARSAARVRAGGLESDVPPGWPKVLNGPLVWTTADLKGEAEFVHTLSDAEKAEIVDALKGFRDLGLKSEQVNCHNFPLPTLGKALKKSCEDVYNGRGFSIVRGFDPDTFSAEDITVIYLGVSSYIGEGRGKQDQRGSKLMHAISRDIAGEPDDTPFHTDTVCDVVGLLTRTCSAMGGTSILASSWTVYNELAATRPDLIHVLSKPDWPFDTYGRDPPYYKRALLYYYGGKVILNFSRRLLTGTPTAIRSHGIPGLTEAQAEALDAVHFIAKKHEVRTTVKKGDMRFINNMGILHCREAFENDDTFHRHLIRLWLNNEKMVWQLPPALKLAWARVFHDHERGSYWDIEPPRANGALLRTAESCD